MGFAVAHHHPAKTDALRYLPPAKYEAELKESEAGFRQLWKEMPWGENGK